MKRIGRRITKSHNRWNGSQLQYDETTAKLDIYSRMKPDHSNCYPACHSHTRSTSSCHHCRSACIATRHSSLVGNAARSAHWYGSGIEFARLLFRLHLRTAIPHCHVSELDLRGVEQFGTKPWRGLHGIGQDRTHGGQLLLQLHDPASSYCQFWSIVSGRVSGGVVPTETDCGQYSTAEVQSTVEIA